MDFERILSRLRSRHAARTLKTAGKQPLVAQLYEALNNSSTRATPGAAKARLIVLKRGAQALYNLFVRLEAITDLVVKKSEACELVGEIVRQAHEIRVAANLSTALQNSRIDPTLKTHLPQAIGKVSRYYSAASELVCAARDRTSRVFRNLRIEPFQITIPPSVQRQGLKVHAEIQLLFFYEANRDQSRPRIICSNKRACYLCNLFFDLHGGFYIPRTHGRLYDKWILPDWIDVSKDRQRELYTILTRLKETLDNKIARVSKTKKRTNDCPNESVLSSLAHWPSSPPLSQYSNPSHASDLTIRPSCPLATTGSPRYGLSDTRLPETPPKTPMQSPFPALADNAEVGKDLGSTDSVESRRTRNLSPLSIASSVTICYDELPYMQPIVLTTPTIYLQLEKVFVILDFVQVASGQLSIVQAPSAPDSNNYQLVNAEDIPTVTERRLDCSHNSNIIQLRLATPITGGDICITFEWIV